MDPCELTALITSFAIAIAKNTPDDDELALIALSFQQLGGMLETIAAQRALLRKNNPD